MVKARDHAAAARVTLEAGFPASATSSAYYAMLFAARAALSEEDKNARTHKGTWMLFQESFVESGQFARDLFEQARKAQGQRERADSGAASPTREEAAAVVADAERFVAAVEKLLA